jgi:hypothetical protein
MIMAARRHAAFNGGRGGASRILRAPAVTAVLLSLAFIAGGARAYAVPDAVIRASGAAPAAKTAQTVSLEKDLEKLAAKEKSLKDQIAAASINKSKLLAQKRSDLKLARQKRDEAINRDIAKIKEKKERQNIIIRELKSQLMIIKKGKNKFAISAMEVSIGLAQVRLTEINADLKIANGRLSQSYKDYKAVYDRLTFIDGELKKNYDAGVEIEGKIKMQKADLKNVKGEYGECVRKKDFLSAERKMGSMVFIQTGINDNYVLVLDNRNRYKNDYYEQIVNYKLAG